MNALAPLKWHTALPAYLRIEEDRHDAAALCAAFESRAFQRLSTNGNRFTLVNLDGEKLAVNQLDPKTGQFFLDVVFIRWSSVVSKTWYSTGYVDGNDASPDCYSTNGQTPDADAPMRQAEHCRMCKYDAFGSGQNGRGKACGDKVRAAFVLASDTPVIVNNAAQVLPAGAEVFGWALAPMTGKNLAARRKQAESAGLNIKGMRLRAHFVSQGVVDFAFVEPAFLDEQAFARTRALAASEAADLAIGDPRPLAAAPALLVPSAPASAPPALATTPLTTAASAFAPASTMFQNPPATTAAAATAEAPARRRGRQTTASAAPPAAQAQTVQPQPASPAPLFPPAPGAVSHMTAAPSIAGGNGVIVQPTRSSPELDDMLDRVLNGQSP